MKLDLRMCPKIALIAAAMSAFVSAAAPKHAAVANAAAGQAANATKPSANAMVNPQIVATLFLAPFNDTTRAATTFGAMINQPLLPAMALGAAQQGLLSSYGTMRSDAPIGWVAFMDADAVKKMSGDFKKESWDAAGGYAMIYPIAGGEEVFMRGHVGSEKLPNGVIKLLAGGKRADETFAKFTKDGAFCAFSETADLAMHAANDFVPPAAMPPSAIARATVNELGMDVLTKWIALMDEAQQAGFRKGYQASCRNKKTKKSESSTADKTEDSDSLAETVQSMLKSSNKMYIERLKNYGRVTIDLCFDDKGLAIVGDAQIRKAAKPFAHQGAPLPEKAFDAIADDAFLAGARNMLSTITREEMIEAYGNIRRILNETRVQLKECDDKDMLPYKQPVDDLLVAVDDFYAVLASLKYEKEDYCSNTISFDAKKRLVVSSKNALAPSQAKVFSDANGKLIDRLAAIIERQWHGSGICRNDGKGGYVFEWDRLVDAVANELQKGKKLSDKEAEEEAQEIAEVKTNVMNVLGGTASCFVIKKNADSVDMVFATQGASATPPLPGKGAERLFAVVPEARRNDTTGYFYMRPYAFTRDILLPILIKCADKDEVQEYQGISALMPPALPNSALAAAIWKGKDGSAEFALRLTADEIKNVGIAVNAINTAPSSAAAKDDDADDDDY